MARPLDPAALDQLFREAHTAYTFAETPIPETTLADLWELVKYGPTSWNSQPLRVVEARSEPAKARLTSLLHPSNRPKTLTAPLTVILAADTRFDTRLAELFPALPTAAQFYTDPATREQHARLNAAIQIGYFFVAVRALGLAVGPVGGLDHAAVDAAFFADSPWRTVLVANIGLPGPDAFFPRSPRLPADEVLTQV